MLPPFQTHSPRTVGEAVALLQRFGDSARIYAGGTELLLVMKVGFLTRDQPGGHQGHPRTDGNCS